MSLLTYLVKNRMEKITTNYSKTFSAHVAFRLGVLEPFTPLFPTFLERSFFCFHCHTSDSHLFSLQMYFLGGSFTFDKNRHIVQLCLATHTHTPCQLLSVNSTVVSRHEHFLANTV